MNPTTTTTSGAAPAPTHTPLRSWLTVVAVAIGTFSIVTTEMLPVGLLTGIGSALHVSDGLIGLTVSLPGLVAAVAAPTLTVVTARLDRRHVLWALAAVLLLANLVSALAPTFAILLAARLLVGVTIGGFWAIAAGLGARVVPERSAGLATSVIFAGIAVASVLGVPLGTFIGDLAGWRTAFAAISGLNLLLLVALVVLPPPLPSDGQVRLGAVGDLLREAPVRIGVAVTTLIVVGHFAAYTYVRPVLEQVGDIAPGLVAAMLLAYGIAGVVGNFVAGQAAVRDVRRTLIGIASLLAVAVLATPTLAPILGATSGVLLVAWGLAYGGVSVSVQTWFLRSGGTAPEARSAIFVATFNGAIALGSFVGGRIVDSVSVSGALWFGGLLALLAVVPLVSGGRRWRHKGVGAGR